MIINNCTHQRHNKFAYPRISNNTQKTSFKGYLSYLKPIISDAEKITPAKTGVSSLGKIFPGLFGTQFTYSQPLADFSLVLKNFPELKNKGLSTNILKYGNVFLKAKSDIPLSTSGVEDCSVVYLFNNRTKTHALYHAFEKLLECDLECINKLMPESFTHAVLIPGKQIFWQKHALNIFKFFNFLKKTNPNTIINLNHYSSRMPEIVGYKGQTFEIPIQHIFVNGTDQTQASFPILDLNTYMFEKLEYCNDFQELKILEKEFKKYNPELQEILFIELKKRESILKKRQKAQ